MANTTDKGRERKTVGSRIVAERERLSSQAPLLVPVMELAEGMLEEFIPTLSDMAKTTADAHPDKDFFIEVLTTREKVLVDTFRNRFAVKWACPTPHYSQIVFRFDCAKGQVSLLWAVPDVETCIVYLQNARDVHPSEHLFLSFIIAYHNGDLDKYCLSLEKEIEGSPKLVVYSEPNVIIQ